MINIIACACTEPGNPPFDAVNGKISIRDLAREILFLLVKSQGIVREF